MKMSQHFHKQLMFQNIITLFMDFGLLKKKLKKKSTEESFWSSQQFRLKSDHERKLKLVDRLCYHRYKGLNEE